MNTTAEERFFRFSMAMEAITKKLQKYKNSQVSSYGLHSMHVMFLCSLYRSDNGMTAGELAKSCGAEVEFESDMVKRLSSLATQTYKKLSALEDVEAQARAIDDVEEQAKYYHDVVITAMGELRAVADEIESLVGEKYWPYPTYGKMLFYV